MTDSSSISSTIFHALCLLRSTETFDRHPTTVIKYQGGKPYDLQFPQCTADQVQTRLIPYPDLKQKKNIQYCSLLLYSPDYQRTYCNQEIMPVLTRTRKLEHKMAGASAPVQTTLE